MGKSIIIGLGAKGFWGKYLRSSGVIKLPWGWVSGMSIAMATENIFPYSTEE